ncbi:MAG: hypothetical protein U1E67_11615 [Hyphomicrobiales bacterium]
MTNFRDLANRVLDSTYERLGEAATYHPLFGGMLRAGQPVTVMPTTREIEVQPFDQSRVKTDTYFRVRVSEVPNPTQNGMIVHEGIEWTVTAAPRRFDALGLEWELGCGRRARS